MKRLLIDMDDVICENGFIRMINEFLGTNYKSEDANSYYVNDLIPKDKFEEWVKFFEEKNVYDYVNIVKYAPEVIEKLNKFYDIYIITAYIFRDKPEISGNQLKNKFDYLTKNLPFIDLKKFIFLSDKELVDADIRIYDSVDKLKGKAEMKLLFMEYHNKNITADDLREKRLTRVNSWKEIEKILLEKICNKKLPLSSFLYRDFKECS